MLTLAVAQGIGRFAFTPMLPIMQSEAMLSLAAGGQFRASDTHRFAIRLFRSHFQSVCHRGCQQLLHPVYVSRQTKRFAGQRIAASIDGPRSLARLTGISRKST
jgi:hypothetical protein